MHAKRIIARDMFEQIKISPSILSADFMDLGNDIDMIADAGADWVHVDVMDGHFVPNLTMGVPVVKQLSKRSRLPLDVHLMITNPEVQVPWFLEAGADWVTFHAEAAPGSKMAEIADTIHAAGAKAGIALKPKTPVSEIAPYIGSFDMVLVMSVEPGFSGQSYIEGSDDKVAQVAEIAREKGIAPLIQVDGGIGMGTLAGVVSAGADVLVCGNAVFAAEDASAAVASIKQAAEDARSAGGQS